MLNLSKLIPQLHKIHRSLNDQAQKEHLVQAKRCFQDSTINDAEFAAKLMASRNTSYWSLPIAQIDDNEIRSGYSSRKKASIWSGSCAIVAADGSQIMPSRHEIANCYLINIGTCSIIYGDSPDSSLESVPWFYSNEELLPVVNGRRQIADEQFVSLERNLKEIETLCAKALKLKEKNKQVLSLLDGSLIPWSLNRMSEGYQKHYQETIDASLSKLQEAQIPLLGYVSRSRSFDLVNGLRVWRCPYPTSDCTLYCSGLEETKFPCSDITPVTDRQLLMEELPYGNYTEAFSCISKLSRIFKPENAIVFLYLNVGAEIARIELPLSLLEQNGLLEFALGAVLKQVQLGMGYPVSLTEAHNQALIRGKERKEFFSLIEQQLVNQGDRSLQLSPKEFAKRQGMV
jgi:hypothetical protein